MGQLVALKGAIVLGALALGLAACGGSDGGSAYVEPEGPALKTLKVDAGNLWFKPDELEAPAGIIRIDLDNTESGTHTLAIKGVPGFELEVSGDGDEDSGKVKLAPKEYEFYCTIPGHAEAGMKGTLTVSK